jgi:hypothetical protein
MSIDNCPSWKEGGWRAPLMCQGAEHLESRHDPQVIVTGDLEGPPEARHDANPHPSVSILAGTMPGTYMIPSDVERVAGLVRSAVQRLREVCTPETQSELQTRIWKAHSLARMSSTQAGLGIFASEGSTTDVVLLPFAPHDRVIVGPRFATRDLLYARQHFPLYRVLLIDGWVPRLLEGRGNYLVEINVPGSLPSQQTSVARAARGRRLGAKIRQGRNEARSSYRAVLLAAEDVLDRATAASGELPIIVVGSPGMVAMFGNSSRHADSLIGEVRGWYPQGAAEELANLAQPALAHWDANLRARTVESLRSAQRSRSLVWGVHAAWNAVRLGVVQHLWVDQDYVVPVRIGSDGALIDDPDSTEGTVVDDVVETLIATTVKLGRRVDILDQFSRGRRDAVAVELPYAATVPFRVPVEGRSTGTDELSDQRGGATSDDDGDLTSDEVTAARARRRLLGPCLHLN